MIKNHRSCPLILLEHNKGYQVHPSAIQFLNTLSQEDEYAVLSIVGKSKTGKSFLLNNLLGDQGIFPTNNHLYNSTQGIMISTRILQLNGTKTLVLDSQGFGSLEGNDDRDCKFFILNLLLSSVILYNSMGTIDEQTLNSFSMIVQIGKVFQKQLQSDNSLPALFWVLRDFSLKMQDKYGSPITSKQYLQNALEEQKGNSQTICHKNRIRRVIKSLFTERTCETLVIPTEEISSTTEQAHLRQQFISDFKRFKNKLGLLLQRKGCKMISGRRMTIPIFISALQIYVKCLNKSMMEGSMPKIQNITFQLRQSQAKGCKTRFENFLNEKKRDILEQISEMLKSKDNIEDLEEIKNRFLQPVQKFYETTRNNIYQLTGELQLNSLSQLKSTFYQNLERQCFDIIRKCQQLSNEQQEIETICQLLTCIPNEVQLDYQYAQQVKKLKQSYAHKDKKTLVNSLMKVQLIYLRRKLELSKQLAFKVQKLTLELEYTKKELHALQARNKQLQFSFIQQIKDIKDSRKDYLTPTKLTPNIEKTNKSNMKEPGMIRVVHNQSIKKELSNQKNMASYQKFESSSFYYPYVSILKPEYLVVRILRTLIKQDNKKNNFTEYVIDVNLMGQKWTVLRKFKDFSELHSILVMMFQEMQLPDCKVIIDPLCDTDFNTSKKEAVDKRRKLLEIYLHQLLQIEQIRNSRIVQKFLKINKQYTVL